MKCKGKKRDLSPRSYLITVTLTLLPQKLLSLNLQNNKPYQLGGLSVSIQMAHTIKIILKKDFIHFFMRDTHTERQRHKQREKQAPCGEPAVGLDLRTPGSHPEPAIQGAQHLFLKSHFPKSGFSEVLEFVSMGVGLFAH